MYWKNTAGQYLGFGLVDANTGGALTGATVSAVRSISGGSQASVTGTVTEKGNGQYSLALSQADTNGDNVSFMFWATDAIPVEKDITPMPVSTSRYKSRLFTSSGSFDPATDGEGRTVFTVRYGGGGGGGETTGGAGGGQGQIFEIRDVTISSSVTVTIGAGGAANTAGGDTTLTGGFVAVARGGTGAASTTPGKTYAPGHRAQVSNPMLVVTGGTNGTHGRDGLMNPSAVFLHNEWLFTGGIVLSPGGTQSVGGGGAGGYQGAGGSYPGGNGVGYCSGGAGNGGLGKGGFVEFVWQ